MKIFDMDGTICESKQKISLEMKKKLQSLGLVTVISGASRSQMRHQLRNLNCVILAQSGNDTSLWQNKLTAEEKIEIWRHASKYCKLSKPDNMEDRGCQMSYSFTGHDAPLEQKLGFDPQGKCRRNILKKFPFNSETLQVTVAGTTCLDYTKKNGTKGKNIERWIRENNLKKKDCIYYGDKLGKGGNDESVIGIIKTVAVKNPNDLMKKL